MLPEIVTTKDAETYEKAMKSVGGVFFVTDENEKSKDRADYRDMAAQMDGGKNESEGSGVSGLEQTDRDDSGANTKSTQEQLAR